MRGNERARVMLAAGCLGAGLLLIGGRLVQLQVVRAAESRRAVDRQSYRVEPQPAPRGAVRDRRGQLLAHDRPVFLVRAEWYARVPERAPAGVPPGQAHRLAGKLAAALHPSLADARAQAQSQLVARVHAAPTRPERDRLLRNRRDGGPAEYLRKVDFLVQDEVDSSQAIERLRELDRVESQLTLHFTVVHERVYPDRPATIGPVGFLGEMRGADGSNSIVRRGIERLAALLPGLGGGRLVQVSSLSTPYFTGCEQLPERARILHTTLDLDLQKAAQIELEGAVAHVVDSYQGSPPDWGALLLVEIETGNLLAMASYSSKADAWSASFAPAQCQVPPGSVVKPLLFAVALQNGRLDWHDETFDCRSSGPDHRWRVPDSSRVIRDDHACGVLTAEQILVQSSNIGAVQVGMRLGRKLMAEYVDRFGFDEPTGCAFPSEKVWKRPRPIESVREREFHSFTGPSVSFGYELHLTPLQIARAYLTLLSGRERTLRLFEAIEVEGVRHELPRADAGSPPFLSPATLDLLRRAMTRVVSSEPAATGRPLHAELRRLGLADGLIGGKTGTSEYEERRKRPDGSAEKAVVRTASFAGFAPAAAPRWLAVCVLQKERAAKFYGGQYASVAAGRLLLRALAQDGAAPAPGTRRLAMAGR
jgi:cell division protein FtsI/penicillin-binding protein 2